MLFLNAGQMDFPWDFDSELFVPRRDPLLGSSGCGGGMPGINTSAACDTALIGGERTEDKALFDIQLLTGG
jgi:hypothetical protein